MWRRVTSARWAAALLLQCGQAAGIQAAAAAAGQGHRARGSPAAMGRLSERLPAEVVSYMGAPEKIELGYKLNQDGAPRKIHIKTRWVHLEKSTNLDKTAQRQNKWRIYFRNMYAYFIAWHT